MKTVAIIHRHRMVAEGLAAALSRFPSVSKVQIATDVISARRLATSTPPIAAVALDRQMPDSRSIAFSLRRRGVRVVLIAGDNSTDAASSEAGWMDTDETMTVSTDSSVVALADALVPGASTTARPLPLTTQQSRVLGLIAKGLTARQIGREMGISEKTVEQHKSKIFQKLGVPNQAAAVRVGVSSGFERSTA